MLEKHLKLEIYCPVCASRREIIKHQPKTFRILLQSIACSVAICGIVFFLFSFVTVFWLCLAGFVGSFLIFEFLENRNSKKELVCPVCDFDPLLYRRFPGLARDRVLKRLELRKRWVEQKVKLRLSQMGEMG